MRKNGETDANPLDYLKDRKSVTRPYADKISFSDF